jgi:hypothetical protein
MANFCRGKGLKKMVYYYNIRIPEHLADLIWECASIEMDIPEYSKCRKRKDTVDLLSEFFDSFCYEDEPYLEKLTEEEQDSFLSETKGHYIRQGIDKWHLDLEKQGRIEWKIVTKDEGIEL